jgi:hypothetical protein
VWITEDGRQLALTEAEMPPLEDLLGAPHRFDIRVAAEGEPAITLAAEIMHTFPNQITEDNDNINGVDWQLGGNPIAAVECMAKLTGPDGSVGYAHIERCARRDTLSPCP